MSKWILISYSCGEFPELHPRIAPSTGRLLLHPGIVHPELPHGH